MGSDRNPGIVSTAGLAKVAGELRELPRQRVTTHGGVRIQALPDEQRIVAEWVPIGIQASLVPPDLLRLPGNCGNCRASVSRLTVAFVYRLCPMNNGLLRNGFGTVC